MKRLQKIEQIIDVKDYVLQDRKTGEMVNRFDTEVEALYWYGCVMRVMGPELDRRLFLRKRHGVDYPVLYDPVETFTRALTYV